MHCKSIKKPLSFLPAILIMCIIFSFSSQNGAESGSLSHTISVKIIETVDFIFGNDWDKEDVESLADRIETPVRKLAHMTEYAVFALSVMFPLYVYDFRNKRLFLTTVIFCICFAASDEYHQSFVAGRGPSATDVLIDSVGVMGGAFIGALFIRFKKYLKTQ